MKRMRNLWILGFWVILLAVSYSLFSFLSNRPDIMLIIEEIQPSDAYRRGREWVKQGKYEEAIASFWKGTHYFQNLYQQTQNHNHLIQYVQGLLYIANTRFLENDLASQKEAIELYTRATLLEPGYAMGQPHLSKGLLLRRMNRFQEAVESFSQAIQYGNARISLDATFERATSFLNLKQYPEACQDYYVFLRYKDSVHSELLIDLLEIPDDVSPYASYIKAFVYQNQNQKQKAVSYWKKYLDRFPADRSATFYYGILTNADPLPQETDLPVEDCFPLSKEHPYRLASSLIDVYVRKEGNYRMQLELSTSASDELQWPVVFIQTENNSLKKIVVESSLPSRYEISLYLPQGKHIVSMEIPREKSWKPVTPVNLFSLELHPE